MFKREIKFRAWDKDNENMWHWNSLHACFEFKSAGEMPWKNFYNAPNIILMQFTGLKDKNGKEIYEGDIVKTELGDVYEVKWDESWAAFIIAKGNSVDSPELMYQREEYESIGAVNRQNSEFYGWEIIGNICENPELLK